MRTGSSALRNGLIVWVVGFIALGVSVAAAGQEGDPLLTSATLGDVTDSEVQTASGVIKTLHRLALGEEYTVPQANDLIAMITGLIADDVPPGTILQVAKRLLEDIAPDELLTTLGELGQRILDGEPPGQVANDLLGRGNAKEASGVSQAKGKKNADDGDEDQDDENGNAGGGNGKGKKK